MTTTAINWNKLFDLGMTSQKNATANNVLCAFNGANATASTNVSTLNLPMPTALQADLDAIEKVRTEVKQALSPRSTRSPAAAIVGRVGGGEALDSTGAQLEIHESLMRESGAYTPVFSQVDGLLNLQRADALVRHGDDLMGVMREIAAPMFARIRTYLDLGTNVRLDDREASSKLSADAVSAWALAREADADLSKLGQVVTALGHLMTPEISCGGLLLFAELRDADIDGLSQKYQTPRVDIRAPWMAVEAGEAGLASPSEYLEREQAVSEQSARAMEDHAQRKQDAWKGIVR